jgi:rhamnosyltransferase
MTTPTIVMRARNDRPVIARTLAALARQTVQSRLIVFDNQSTDGTEADVAAAAAAVFTVPAGSYVPGKVLNAAMREAASDIVVFLNSDCVPDDPRWLEKLLAGFTSDAVAAVFGRQRPRPDCTPLLARDTEAAFGDGTQALGWRHHFSMANSAIRRSVWLNLPFREDLQYSEDIDWTWRARQQGFEIRYVPDAAVEHSHNYNWRQYYRRQFGEGEAEARIFDWNAWQRSWLRYAALPYVRQVLGDMKHAVRHRQVSALMTAPTFRLAQLLGRHAGFRLGWSRRMTMVKP